MMMTDRERYVPGSGQRSAGTKGRREVDAPSRQETASLTGTSLAGAYRPAHLRQWAPFVVDGSLGTLGAVNLTWVGTSQALETKVTRADVHSVLEYGDIRWEVEASGSSTRLTLWHKIDRRFISWGAAGWHISLYVLDCLLSGTPIGSIVGVEAMKFDGWQRLYGEYAKQFGVEMPNWAQEA